MLCEYLRRSIDRSQIKSFMLLKNGKLLVDFTSSAPGSERDALFRSKVKLKGSGLNIAESLTPRRQAMFQNLLQLKRKKKIFSVFTRSGNILVTRSRDSAPVRVADPEAVSALSEAGVMRHPVQGRAQAENAGGQRPGGVVAGEEGRDQEQSAADASCPRPMHREGVLDREASGTAASCVRHVYGSELQRASAELESVFTSPDGEVSRRQPPSTLRAAREVLRTSSSVVFPAGVPGRRARGSPCGGLPTTPAALGAVFAAGGGRVCLAEDRA